MAPPSKWCQTGQGGSKSPDLTGVAAPGGRFCSAGGWRWLTPLSHLPTRQRFWKQGGLPLYPRRGLRPLHPAWGRAAAFSRLARRNASWPGDGTPFLAFPEYEGRDRGDPGGGCAPCTPLGERGFDLACALLQRGVCFGQRRCPTCPPSNVLETGGLPLYPGGGCAPCTPLGEGGVVVACALLQRGDWLGLRRCPTGPPSNVLETGGHAVPPVGAAPPAPRLGDGRGFL